MGFTVTASLFGLPSFCWYVSIRGSYTIEKKNTPLINDYLITYTIYYAGPNTEAKISDSSFMYLQLLPSPANVYLAIYANIKTILGDLQYIDD